ncbi:MAG: transposase [Candidatus Bathyarchaeia archaeon]|jgi:putative transposase
MPPKREINELSYKTALSTLKEHFTIPLAPNSKYTKEQLIKSLLYLTVQKQYAESGLQNLACTQKAPSADTLLRRLKSLNPKDAYKMLTQANDAVIEKLKRKRAFKKPVLAAIDLSCDRYYGKDNNQIRKGKCDRGTRRFYMHASLHVVEAGKRVTVFTMPLTSLDDDPFILETLLLAARARGIRIRTLLVDRGFHGVNVVNKLKQLRQPFLAPAIRTSGVKRAILAYDRKETPAEIDFRMVGTFNRVAFCRLFMVMKHGASPDDLVVNRYNVFLTNLSILRVILAFEELPEEYRKRWGIETGFRMHDAVEAKTTSTNRTVRVVYTLMSTFVYNVWVLANVVFAKMLRVELKRSCVKLFEMAHHFRREIEQPHKPPAELL